MNNKVAKILEGAVILALGILIAVNGIGSVVDIYFGIVALVGGIALLLLAIIGLSQKNALSVGDLILGSILVTVGVCLFTPWLTFAELINLFIIVILGLGIGLTITGIIFIAKKALFTGLGEVLVGVLMIVFAIIYKVNPDFRQAFWIIIGILVAIYGVLVIIDGLISKKK